MGGSGGGGEGWAGRRQEKGRISLCSNRFLLMSCKVLVKKKQNKTIVGSYTVDYEKEK